MSIKKNWEYLLLLCFAGYVYVILELLFRGRTDISMLFTASVCAIPIITLNDVYKKISVLSPGERSRVALAKLSLSGSNLLVLDEPTNHLDPETQEIIADTFKTFKGSMLLVSHNPSFVDNLGVERVLILPSGKIDYYSRELVEHYQKINSDK